MSNKLKDIFSDKKVDFGGNISFKDHEAYENFLEALKLVENEGKYVKVEGVTSVQTTASDGESQYPFLEQGEIVDFIVCPSYDEVPFEVDTAEGKQSIIFKRYHTKSAVILETDKNAIVYIKMTFEKGTTKTTFSYKTQPEKAGNIREITENYELVLAFLNRLFSSEKKKDFPDEFAIIENIKDYLTKSAKWYQKLDTIEHLLNLSFNLKQIDDASNTPMDLEELYLLLVEKKILRLNAKLHATEATSITVNAKANQLEIGSPLDITFQGTAEYLICGEKILLHTANLLSNAIVKEFEQLDDGSTKVLYGEDDSNPMYISYSGFLSEEEATKEVKAIMKHKDSYQNAMTVNEYL